MNGPPLTFDPWTRPPRLLDLFAGAGGASRGYQLAGFHVTAIDWDSLTLRRNPADRTMCGRWDMLTPEQVARDYDAVHASPPCQAYSITRHTHAVEHPDLVPAVREWLQATGLPYVIENVPGAPLIGPVTLCGTMFGLEADDPASGRRLFLERHRLFESNVDLGQPPSGCRLVERRRAGLYVGGVYGGASRDIHRAQHVRKGGYTPPLTVRRALMGIDWTTQDQLSQAIPPAYTRWVGTSLLAHLTAAAVTR